jgi:hypothetical protein
VFDWKVEHAGRQHKLVQTSTSTASDGEQPGGINGGIMKRLIPGATYQLRLRESLEGALTREAGAKVMKEKGRPGMAGSRSCRIRKAIRSRSGSRTRPPNNSRMTDRRSERGR